MLLTRRSTAALRAAPRLAQQSVSSSIARRTMVTAAERWNEDDWHAAHALVKAQQIDLKQWVPDIEGKWKHMTKAQQIGTWVLLEDIQKKDWNELSANEKRAAYFICYGPYGPRAEDPPGIRFKIFVGTVIGLAAGVAMTMTIQNLGGAKHRPASWNPIWQEAMNEKAREQQNDPITGIASEDYKGPGYVVRYPI